MTDIIYTAIRILAGFGAFLLGVKVLGDNLETDIRLGFDHGVETVFVTSGVHQREDIARLGVYPDHVVDDLRELIGADGEICLPK